MKSHILGFPSLGFSGELKRAAEGYAAGLCSNSDFMKFCAKIRADNWLFQKSCGLDCVCVGDFAPVDRVLNSIIMLGAIPQRFDEDAKASHPLELSLKMAGMLKSSAEPLASARWFDSRLFVSVPEIEPDTEFSFFCTKILEDTVAASEAGYAPKPCMIGPFTFTRLARCGSGFDKWSKIYDLADVYCEILEALKEFAPFVQIAEPVFAEDYLLMNPYRALIAPVYERLNAAAGESKIILTSFFDAFEKNLDAAISAGCAVLHVDCAKSLSELDAVLESLPSDMSLSLGVVNGRDCWINDYEKSLAVIERAKAALGSERVMVSTSCSLAHVPLDLDAEGGDMPCGLKKCLAFAKEKCREVSELAALAENPNESVIAKRRAEIEFLKSGQMGKNDDVRFQVRLSKSKKIERAGDFKKRRAAQKSLGLPLCPVALSDTPAVCAGVGGAAKMSAPDELAVLEREAEKIVGFQEGAGLDMSSFGAFECLDAFEFFASELSGFYFTKAGFVQIRGANVAAPPIIYGDVAGRGGSSLSKIARKALAASKKPLKVSVAGPVSILKRSFARADIPEAELARQLAFAVKEEVRSLQIAGVKAVQIDESMLGDILPLKNKSRAEHLAAASECFKIAVSDADISTQILLRLRFNPDMPIVLSLKNMDSDVLILECGGLNLRALELFSQFEYENEIGVALAPPSLESLPSPEELERQIRSALKFVGRDRLRIFTGELLKRADAGFTAAFLKNLTEAAKAVR